MRLRADGRRVDVGDPGVQISDRAECRLQVARVQTAGQPVLDVVVDADRFGQVADPDDAQHWPEDLLLLEPRAGLDTGEHGRLEEESLRQRAVPRGLPTELQVRPLFDADRDVAFDLLERRLVDQGADVGGGRQPVTQPQLRGGGADHLDERVVDRILENQSGRRGAALAGRPERPPQHPLQREIQIGVRQDDLCVLAAHLQREPFVEASTRLTDERPGLRGAGERDQGDAGMFHDRLPHHLAAAVDQLHYLRREPRLQEDLHEQRRRVRHVLGRLEDHGVAAHQRREDLPGGDRQGEVERRDDPRHTDGPPIGHGPLAAQLRRHGVAEQPATFRGGIVRGVDALLHVAPRLRQHLAHLPGHHRGDLLFPLSEEVAGMPQHVAP